MIDNILGSLDFTSKLPLNVEIQEELPKFKDFTSKLKDISPVSINNLLQEKVVDKPVTFQDILKQVGQKNKSSDKFRDAYYISNYEVERFIKSDKDNNNFFNWKKNPIFKDPRYFDNEELNAQNQSGFRQFINGASKALPSAINAFVEGLNPIPGVKENSEFANWIKNWSNELENSHPNFYSKDERDNPLAIRNIADGNFWGDKVLKNAGFTVGAIASAIAWDAAITFATAGTGTAPATAIAFGFALNNIAKKFTTAQKIIRGVKGTSMLGKATKGSIAAFEGFKNYSTGQKALTFAKLGYINYVGSNAEASIEGYEGLTSLNEQMIDKFIEKNGRTPLAHEYASIKKIATEMANTRYAINLPLLMITNAIEFGTLFSPSKLLTTGGVGFGEKIGVDAAGQLFKRGWKNFSKLEKVGRVLGSSPVKNFLAEGFQEGMQYSIEKATEDLAFKKFANPNFRVGLSEYMESQALGLQKTFSENEGLESMFIGGLTGLITSAGTSSWDKFVSRKSQKEDMILGENIEKYNELSKEGILNSDDFKEYIKLAAERDQINFDGTLTHTILDAQMQQAIEDNNAFAFKALQHDKLFNLVSLANKLGKVDAFKLKIDQLKDLSIDEFAKQMGLENLTDDQKTKLSENIDEYIDVVKNKVDQMSEIIKTVDNSLLNTFDPQKNPVEFNAFNELKNTFAFQLSNIDDIKGRMTEEMDDILSDKLNPLSQNMINGLLGEDLNEESLMLDDFTKNFVTEQGFDLNILNNKYAKAYTAQLNDISSQISLLNTQIETAKAAKLPHSGYSSKLAEKKKELTNLTSFLTEFNFKINKFGEVLTLRKDVMHQESIDAYKDLTSHVVKYEMNKDLKNPMSLSKADDLVNAIADLHLLNSSLKLFIDKNNKFQTPKGQAEYIAQYTKWKDYAQNKVQEAVRKSKYETLRRTPEESINQLASEIQTNLTQIKAIKNQIEEIDKQLLDEKTTPEEKELLEKRKEELIKEKQELLDENKELEETKEAIEGKEELTIEEQIQLLEKELSTIEDDNNPRIKEIDDEISKLEKLLKNESEEDLNSEREFESELADRLENIFESYNEIFSSEINFKDNKLIIKEKINTTKEELQKLNQEVITNNDLLIYLNNKLEFYLQKISNEQKSIDKELNSILKLNYPKNTKKAELKKEKYEDIIKKHKNLLLAAQDIQNRINEIENTNSIQKQVVVDLTKKIQYYQSILNTNKTQTTELQQKLATTQVNLEKTNKLIEKTKSYINRLKSFLKEIVKAITNRISLLDDFLESQNKNTEEFRNNNLKLRNNLIYDGKIGNTDLLSQYEKLEKEVNDVLDHEEINQELLDKAELLLQTQIEKAVKLQNEIRYLNELFQENLNEVKQENTDPNSIQNKKIIEEVIQSTSKEEIKPITEDIKPIETPTETGEKEIIITETPNLILEAKKAPLHGKSRVLMTVGKMKDKNTKQDVLPKDMKFAGGMLQNFYNFMGRFETFDGNLHMHNLNSFLSRNKYKFVLMVAPDVLYTKPDENGRSEYFTEGTQNPDNIVIVLVDETNNPVLINGNYIASKVGKDATKDSAWLNEGKLPDDNQSLVDAIKEVREKGFADLAIESTSAGHYNFIGKKEKFEIKELNPNTSFEIFTHTELKEMGSNFRGYTLLPGKLYLKVVNGRKTVMYLDVSLSKMSNIKVKGEPISKNIFDLINHLNNNEESDVYRKSVENYLNSIFHTYHITRVGKVPAIFRVGESFYKFEVNITNTDASIRIIKDGEVVYELSKEKQDELSKLQSLLKIFDINDKIFFGKEINLPTIEDGKLRFNLIPYTDFILENASPTVNYKLDFSTENPFEYTNGEIYFKLPSKVEEAFSETSTTEITPTTFNQSEIEAKKDDIERRRQEDLSLPVEEVKEEDTWMYDLGTFMTKGGGFNSTTKEGLIKVINAKYDAEYVDAVKKGEMTKEQAMKALEDISRKDSKAYAELAALETQEFTIDEKTLEGFSSQEELFKSFNVKPLEQSNDLSELTKEVVEPIKITKEDKFKGLDDEIPKILKSAKFLPIIQSLNVTNTDIERVKAIFKGNVNIENLFQIVNSDAWATFQQSAITLYKGAARSDLYHEAWHHFSQLYLTKDEKIKLYEETRNKVKDLKDKSDLEVEEYIAREFAKFTETGKIEGKFPERKSIFQKIMDFLKSIFSNETDLSLDSLFNNLYKGQINHLAYNTENIMFGRLNSSINDNFNYNESKLILSGLDALFIQVLEYYKISGSQLSNIENINSVYNSVAKVLKNIYNASFDENEESINPTISLNLGRISDNWNDVKKFHFEKSIIFNKDKNLYTVNEEGQIVSTDENEDEKKGRNKADYQEASERSVFDILPSEIKNLIYTLADKDKNGNEIFDPIFGLPKLVDYQRYVQVISQKLSDQTDFSDVEKVLTELSTTYPPMKDLLELLTLNDSNEVKQLRVKFINSMALAKVKLYTILYNEENKDYQAQDVYSNTRRQAESNAISYFNISPETRFIKKINGENQITQIGNVDYNEDNVALLKDLGMDMSFTDYMSTEQLSSFLKNLQIPFLVNHLRGYLKQHGVIKDVFKALNTKIDGQSRDSVFKRIVKADLEVNPAYISATSLNAENKLESENVLWSTITKDIKSIQKVKSISELVQNPNRSHFNFSAVDMDSSVLLNLMFDKNGNRTNFEISVDNYNGINNTKQGETGVKTKNVYYIEKAIMDISQFVNNNILTTMQLSNKATYLGFKLSNKLFNDKYDFEEKMLKYLFTELDIIEKFHNGDPELTKLKKLSEAIGTKDNYNFAIFKDIITYDTQEIINEYLETGNLSGKTKTNILEQINSFFNEEKRLHAVFLGESLSEIVPSSGSKYSKDTLKETLLDDYIKNQFIFNVELSKITFGNPYMHKDPYKRIAGATSTGTRLLVDDLTLQDFESATKETQRSSIMSLLLDRLGLKEFNLKNQRSSNKELRFITFNDREMPSKYYNDLLDAVNSELSKHQENSPEYKALLEKKKSIQKAYSKVNGSDAMGAVTMDAWRKFNWLAGRWTPELEKIYEKTIKWDYHNRLLKQTTNEEEKVKQLALRNENAIDEAEKLAISVMKYQYYGNVKNTTIMEKAFHKFQLMPLIPQLIEGKLYEHHLDRMIMEDVDYLLFDSADKLEKTKTPNNFYNNKEQDNVFVLEDFVNTYRQGDTSYDVRTGFIENLKEQVFMENGTDYSLLFGTQIRALLFNTDSFSDLYDEFRDVINQLTQIEKDKLYEKASLNSNGEVIDKNKFVQFLLDELDKKVVNYNVKDYLRLTKAGEFAGSLDTNLQRTPIESIINSVIQNKIVKQKMHGEMMVQVSNVGFETFGKKDSLKFYGYEQDGKVRKMEVKIPLSGKFKNLLNLNYINTKGEVQGKIESRERLNDMISRGLIDTRAITMVGYRIPTQEHNSVEVMIVQEFLDPISNLIVVPYEITAKAGSDFDIDKLNIFKPHIDENGNYITNIEKPTDLDYINLSEIKEKIKAKKETVQKSWEIQSNKLQKLYNERLINKEEVSNNIEELRYTLRETNIEIAFLKEDILILKELNQENKAVSNLLITIFSDNAIKNKNLEEIIKEKEDKILKYNNDNKLRKELIEQFKELSTKSSEEIVRIEKRKQTQEKYLSDLNALFIELNDISYKIKNYKASKQNRIIEIFEKVLLAPDNFINLITPNSTSLFDEAINNVFKVRYTEQERQEKKGVIMPKDIVYTNSLLPRNSWDMHRVFGDSGKGLGIAAVGNKFSQLIQKAKVNFTDEYLEKYNLRFKLGNLSNRNFQNGESKGTAFSQLINLLVDVANDPRVGYVNMGDDVIPIVNLMINFGINIEQIIYLINQPIVVDYVDYVSKNSKRLIKSKNDKTSFSSYLAKKVFNSKSSLPTISKEYEIDKDSSATEIAEKLGNIPLENKKENIGLKISQINSEEQLLILSQFVQFEEMAADFLELQMTMNFDTNLVQDGFEAFQKENSFEDIKTRNIFTNLDELKYNTVISPLNVLKEVVNINAQLLPLANSKLIYNFLSSKLSNDFKFKTNKHKAKFIRTFKNDFIMYLFQNFLGRSEKALLNFNTTFAPVLKTKSIDKKPFFTLDKALTQKTFRKKDLEFVDNIPTTKDKPVALRNTGTKILINSNLLEQKYNEKAWLNSATQKDGSKSTSLDKNQFSSFEEFFTFVLIHEIKHDSIKKENNETIGQYEDRINNAALLDLKANYNEIIDFTNKPNEFGIHLIKNLYKEFAEIKNNPKYKDLFNQYLLLDRLFVTSEEEFKNIGLSYYNKDSELQNTYIEQFKELLNNPDLEIKNFMLKFAYMGFYQSGLNKSLMSSTDILPIKLLSPILENIREQYLSEINDDRKLLSTLYDFHKLMYDNNEFMRSNKEMKNSDGSPIFYDKNGIRRYNSPLNNRTKVDSKRFKNYTSNIDKVLEDAKPLIPSNTIQKEIVQEDKFIFEYKGKKINTEFELSEDQSQALKELIDFTKDSNESAIVLQGAAGTGKTSIIGYLQKYLNEQFLYTAPTHAATVELAFGTMKTGNTILPITVASSLRLNKDTDKYVLSRKAANKIGFGTIIVIDETSMLNTYDYKRLLDLKELGYKLIFIGDKKQIPEVSKVKDLDFKTISNAFVENKIINLDVIHRTSNKNIKNILQKVRDSITFQLFKLKENTNNVQFFKSDISFKQKLKEFVLKDPQNTDYIAYTNKAVSSMNKLIREQIFGRKGEIQKDDIVMGYLGYQSKQIEKSDLANSISYEVEKVEKTKNGYNLTLSSERLDKLREKGFTEIGEFSYTTLLPLSNKEAIENSFDQKIYDENNQNLSNRFKILYEYLQQAKNTNSGRDWNKYYTYHESLSNYMSKIDLAADYIYNIHTNQFEFFDKTEPSKEHAKLLSFYKTESNNFIVEKGIDFGHAITVHKSQGRTTKNVFFDANTINKGDTKIMEKDVQISTENQSLGYVGLSRASENLFVNEGWVSFKEIDTVEEDNTPTQQTTEQPINKEIKINEIYNQLGDKTKSENVILPKDVDPEADNIGMTYTTAIDFWRKIVPAAMDLYNKSKPLIVAFRGNSKKTFLQNYNSGTHTIGNPFDFRDEAGDRKEQGVTSTKKFIEWMITGNNFGNINASEEYRQAIIKDIKSGKLKKASILYYEEKGYATHATALDYLINKYDWNKEQPTEIKPKIDSSKKIEDLKRGDIINFQQQEFLVERVKNEGIDVRDVNTGDVDFISTEDYINETQEQPIVKEITKEDTDKLPPCTG